MDGRDILTSSSSQDEEASQADDSVEKIDLPYLDCRIDPDHLEFNEQDPARSRIKQSVNSLKIDIDKESYALYHILGSGHYGDVYLSQNERTGEWIAIKRCNLPQFSSLDRLEGEIEKLKVLGNLVACDLKRLKTLGDLGLAELPEEKKFFYVGMKLIEGVGLATINKPGLEVSLPQKLAIAKSLTKNLAHLHHDVAHMKGEKENKEVIFHRDIKLENIIYNSDCVAQLCDYGYAITANEIKEKTNDQKLLDTKPTLHFVKEKYLGSVPFIAPEIWRQEIGQNKNNTTVMYDEATEIYALGVVFARMFGLLKTYPTIMDISYRLSWDQLLVSIEECPSHVPEKLYQLILSMLNLNPTKRPTAVNIARDLNTIFNQVGEDENHALKVCVISVDDFLQFSQNEKEKFLETLKQSRINTIVLKASNETSIKDYYRARYQITQLVGHSIINVAPFMAKGDNEAAIYRMAKDHYDDRFATINTKVFLYENGKIEQKTQQANTSTPPKEGFFTKHPLVRDILIGAGVGLVVLGIIAGAVAITAATHGVGTIPYLLTVAKSTTILAFSGSVVAGFPAFSGALGEVKRRFFPEFDLVKKIKGFFMGENNSLEKNEKSREERRIENKELNIEHMGYRKQSEVKHRQTPSASQIVTTTTTTTTAPTKRLASAGYSSSSSRLYLNKGNKEVDTETNDKNFTTFNIGFRKSKKESS